MSITFHEIESKESISIAVSIPAPKITGSDKRKENRAALWDGIPKARPVQMVNPEREIPGMIANACAIPINSPFKYDNSVFPAENRFEISNTIPVHIKAIPTKLTFSKIISIRSLNRNPAKIAGIVPTTNADTS